MGLLKGFDHVLNLVLAGCEERVFTAGAPCEIVALGLFLVRGDNVASVGEIDEEADAAVDWSTQQAAPLRAIVHTMA